MIVANVLRIQEGLLHFNSSLLVDHGNMRQISVSFKFLIIELLQLDATRLTICSVSASSLSIWLWISLTLSRSPCSSASIYIIRIYRDIHEIKVSLLDRVDCVGQTTRYLLFAFTGISRGQVFFSS